MLKNTTKRLLAKAKRFQTQSFTYNRGKPESSTGPLRGSPTRKTMAEGFKMMRKRYGAKATRNKIIYGNGRAEAYTPSR